jgi:type IX secretion system PorP/SprF family membrane protein
LLEYNIFTYFTVRTNANNLLLLIDTVMQMRKVVLWVAVLFLPTFVMAQQDPNISQFMFTPMAINPGFAGSNDDVRLLYWQRLQWVGMPGSPNTAHISADAAISPFNINSGVGLDIMTEKIGFENNKRFNFAYAYRMNLPSGKLAVGASLGFINDVLDPKWKSWQNGTIVDGSTDNAVPVGDTKGTSNSFDVGLGVLYKTEKYYVGFSSSHINKPKLNYKVTGKTASYIPTIYQVTGGYNIQLSNPLLELAPSFYVYTDTKVSQLCLDANVIYNKKFWGGLAFRPGDAIIGMIGFELKSGVKVGYSYDFITSDIAKHSSGGHEFFLGYNFKIETEKLPQKYKSVRFL